MVLEGPDLSACTCSQDACDAGRAAYRILSAPTQPCPAPSLHPPSHHVPCSLFYLEVVLQCSGTAPPTPPHLALLFFQCLDSVPFRCSSMLLDSPSSSDRPCLCPISVLSIPSIPATDHWARGHTSGLRPISCSRLVS